MKKLTKIMGLSLLVVVLLSLLVPAAPVAAADRAFSTVGTPLTTTFQIGTGTDASFVTVAPNGDIFAVDTEATGTANIVYKSTTDGRTWTASALITGIVGNIVDIAVSPSYATDSTVVVVTTAGAGTSQVFVSTSGGASFAALGGAIATNATSIAIAPNYNAGGEIMVGGCDATATAGDATLGDVYFWGRSGTLNWVTATTGLTEDVLAIAYSPNFAIDLTRIAVSATAASGVRLHTLVSTDTAWETTLTTISVIDAATDDRYAGGILGTTAAAIAFPSDFNASLTTSRTLFVAVTNLASTSNVYRAIVSSASTPVTMAPLALFGIADQQITSLAYSGTLAAGQLIVGATASTNIMRTYNPTAAAGSIAWVPTSAAPTGTGNTALALAADFATSSKIYAGTGGAATDESALSISMDGGATFFQAGLIDTPALIITDVQAASATNIFMVTSDGAGGVEAAWETTDGGATWYRVLAVTSAGTSAILRLSPAFDTDSTAYFGILGTTTMRITNNGGDTWSARSAPMNIADITVASQYNFYVGGTTVQSSANGGWTYTVRGAPAVAVSSLAFDSTTGHLLAGLSNGTIARNVAGITWVPQGAAIGAGATVAIFDVDYATNNIIYAADTAAAGGVERFNTATPTVAWAPIDGAAFIIGDIVQTSEGVLYASGTAAAANGVERSLNPTAAAIPAPFAPDFTNSGTGLTAALGGQFAVTGNVIIAIRGTTALVTYTDTLYNAAVAVNSPEDGAIAGNPAAIIASWTAVTGAIQYQIQWDTRSDFLAAIGTTQNVNAPLTSVRLANGAVNPPAGAINYYRVRVSLPVEGPWTAIRSFNTQLAAAISTAPVVPAALSSGSTGPGGVDVALQPSFVWGAIGGVTGYEFQLATDADFTSLVVDATGADMLGAAPAYYYTTGSLDYSTTYFWKVRGISATSNTDWTAAIPFRTMDEPVVQEPVEVTQAPAITFTMPAAPAATTFTIPQAEVNEIAPAYIWAIIIIGAVLVIAVIVLIVRTRRAV